MNTKDIPSNRTRRGFLQTTGLLALAAPASLASASGAAPSPARWWHGRGRFKLLAEGVVENILEVMPPIPWVLPPLVGSPMPINPLVEEVRMRVVFPVQPGKDLLAATLFLAGIGSPIPFEGEIPMIPWLTFDSAGVPTRQPAPCVISSITIQVTDLQLSEQPVPNLALLGLMVANDIPSPYGDLSGYTCAVTAGVDENPDGSATFANLAIHAAGSHTTMARIGHGDLALQP